MKHREIYKASVEAIAEELGRVKSIDDFFGKEGIFAKLFARTIEEMLAAEVSAHLGYEKYEAKGRIAEIAGTAVEKRCWKPRLVSR